MTSMMQITIPCKPLSSNHIYSRSRSGGTFLKREAKDFKYKVASSIDKLLNFDESKHYISVEYFFYLNSLYTKKGTINKKSLDLDNCLKILQDAIFDKLKINDSFILDSKSLKRYGNEDKIIVIIRVENREFLEAIAIE